MEHLYSISRSILELLYFLSGIGLLIGLIIAYKQYLKTTEDIQLKYAREISRDTAKAISGFYFDIMPLFREYEASINQATSASSKKLTFYFDEEITQVNFTDQGIDTASKSYLSTCSPDTLEKMFSILNKLNILAIDIESGLLDSKKIAESIGHLYIRIFQAIFPIYFSTLHITTKEKEYTQALNVFILYFQESKKQALKAQVSTLQEKVTQLETAKTNPPKELKP